MTRWLLSAVALLVPARVAWATMPPPSGGVPEVVAQAFAEGLFQLPERLDGLPTSTATGTYRIPVILAAFADGPLTFDATAFSASLFDTTGSFATGSVQDYYRWASRGRLNVVPEIVATVTLPHGRSYYGSNSFGLGTTNTPQNAYGATRDAVMLCPHTVDWSRFDRDRDGHVEMLWLVHAGQPGEATLDRNDLWSITSSATGWRLGGPIGTPTPVPGAPDRNIVIRRFTILPELSGLKPDALSEIGVYCHEFGHALGLPDLYDATTLGGGANAGPGNWSLMSTGGYGANGVSPESPSHLGAWPLQFLGWDHTVRPARDTTLTLAPLAESGDIIDFWFEGESAPEHFLIENRQRGEQFDRWLPSEGLIVYHVDDILMGIRTPFNSVNSEPEPALLVIEGDGDDDLRYGRNRGDGSDPLPGSLQRTRIDDETVPHLRTFQGAITQLAIEDIERIAGDLVRLSLRVRAPHWLATREITPAEFAPMPSYGPATTSGVDDAGVAYLVRSEWRAGRSQVILMTSADDWGSAFQVSAAPSAAFEPSLAILPGGDLAVVWSDIRGGRSQLFFRSRIAGVWTPERRLAEVLAEATSPALAADRFGRLSLAFLATESDTPRVHFMQFTYRSPGGRPRPVSPRNAYPSLPAVAMAPDGVAYTIWAQRTTERPTVSSLWFARSHPDSGPQPALEYARGGSGAPTSLTATLDRSGTLHVVWVTSGPGSHLLRYQRRTLSQSSAARDTILETRGLPIQGLSLAADPEGTLHLSFESVVDDRVEARYRRWHPNLGWDAASTLVSDGIHGNAFQPVVLPRAPLEVSVAFIAYPGETPGLFLRHRTDGGGVLAAPIESTRSEPSGFAHPNPLRRGQGLELAWSPSAWPDPTVDIYDLAGRRVATVRLAEFAGVWRVRLPADQTMAWQPGVYFAKPRTAKLRAARWVVLP